MTSFTFFCRLVTDIPAADGLDFGERTWYHHLPLQSSDFSFYSPLHLKEKNDLVLKISKNAPKDACSWGAYGLALGARMHQLSLITYSKNNSWYLISFERMSWFLKRSYKKRLTLHPRDNWVNLRLSINSLERWDWFRKVSWKTIKLAFPSPRLMFICC